MLHPDLLLFRGIGSTPSARLVNSSRETWRSPKFSSSTDNMRWIMNTYIYAHLENGEPVYIGQGEGGRAWCVIRSNKEHRQWMFNKLPEDLEVQFIATNLNKNDAFCLETILINATRPRFNTMIGPQIWDGERIFHSSRHACNFHGIDRKTAQKRGERGTWKLIY